MKQAQMWGMTDAPATPPAPESPRSVPARPVSARLDAADPPWPLRPWIIAAICAVAGLIFHPLIDRAWDAPDAPARNALAAFVPFATRLDERRVRTTCVSSSRSRLHPSSQKKKPTIE